MEERINFDFNEVLEQEIKIKKKQKKALKIYKKFMA